MIKDAEILWSDGTLRLVRGIDDSYGRPAEILLLQTRSMSGFWFEGREYMVRRNDASKLAEALETWLSGTEAGE